MADESHICSRLSTTCFKLYPHPCHPDEISLLLGIDGGYGIFNVGFASAEFRSPEPSLELPAPKGNDAGVLLRLWHLACVKSAGRCQLAPGRAALENVG
jgi:hypothetical protein